MTVRTSTILDRAFCPLPNLPHIFLAHHSQ